MKKTILATLFLLTINIMQAQIQSEFDNTRMITVQGNAELNFDADEIIYQITIQEYWKEEFQKNKEYKDYKTKMPMDQIEPEILAQLQEIGIKEDCIKVAQMGNHYRPTGKEFLLRKTLEVTVTDFSMIDELGKKLNPKAVSNMFIKELKNKDMEAHRKKVRIMAVKAAKEKADYLLAALNEKTGKVLKMSEIQNQYGGRPEIMMLNKRADSGNNNSATDIKKITLTYAINITFAIEE